MAELSGDAPADVRLAAEIAAALAEAGLVPRGSMEQVREKLAAGAAREVDWVAWLAPGSSRGEDSDGRSH